jgi:hypothetical protein
MSALRTVVIVAMVFGFAVLVNGGAIPEIGDTASFSRSFDPDFFWLPPTVPGGPTFTGPFDATALDSLRVEVCELDSAGACVAAPLIEAFTSTSRPTPSRIRLDVVGESYTLDWLTGPSRVSRDLFYRVSVFHSGRELGNFDVDFVQNTPELLSVDTARFLGVVRGQQLTIRFRVQHPTARTRVKLNEIESSGGIPGDWAELYNSATVPVSLAGYIIKDNDDTHTYILPIGTEIPPLGYYVVEEAALGFGLGSADAVRFFTPDGLTLVDSYEWTSHAATTYGRCPNGTGVFQTNTTVTKGAANDCSIVIRINEVESSGGTPGDWVELYNAGPGPANVSGIVFKDNDNTHAYTIPEGTILFPGGYYLLEEAALGFGLGSADSARLFDKTTALLDSYSWTAHATTTYGRCPNGTGSFTTTAAPTKGGANNCPVASATVHINEVESNGGAPGDWVELINTGANTVDISGWRFLDNDDTHIAYILPPGSTISAGSYLVLEEAAFGFGLGNADSVRLFDSAGVPVESYSWTAHATTTYGRCPNGTGDFITTTSVTKGTANDCGNPVKINEVESNNGVPGDWVELHNPSGSSVDISGLIFRDNDDTHTYTIPVGTTIPSGGYYLLEEAVFGFGLGSADSARLFDATGLLLDSYTWAAHATTTYGRCPNGTGAFTTTNSATKGATNDCPGQISFLAWPGGADVQTVDGLNIFGGNLSGLMYEGSGSAAPGVLWAVRNGPGSLFRLLWDGAVWTPDLANNWSAGKILLYPGGTGSPDSEGVTFAGPNSSGGIYVAIERDNNVSGTSRNSILRFDAAAPGVTLTATHEWNLTADLPVVGANLGMEAITWIPDAFLVPRLFFDESKGHVYNPGEYPNHGTGLFFVGLEANGMIYAYALDHAGGGFTRIATIASGLAGVMDLHFDRDFNDLWAVCDDTCLGRSAVLRTDAVTGRFVAARFFERPSLMPNLNNEGFAMAPITECATDRRPAFWADDSETGGHAIRRGSLTCSPF